MTPDTAVSVVETFCETQIPEHARAAMRFECSRRGNSITISERRPPWKEAVGPEWTESKIAQLRYQPTASTWALYFRGSDDRWHLYDAVEPAQSVAPLLAEVDEDPTGIFWG